jgi:predicted nuclease of predicted toxin-antitoxin system
VRLLLDEMLSPRISRILREKGHDVIAICEREQWNSLSDDEVINLARTERRGIVTNNLRDFRSRALQATLPGGPGHFGMVFIPTQYRLSKKDIGRLINALEVLLDAYPEAEALLNQETWV